MRTTVKLLLPLIGVVFAASSPSGAAAAAEAEKFIPADADAVISVNVRQLVDSPAFQKYGKADALQGLQSPSVRALLDALGLKPLKDVDSLLLTSSGDVMADNPRVLLVVRGQFDVDRIRLAARLYAAEHPADLTVGEADGQTLYQGTGGGKTLYAVLTADGTTLLASTDKDYLLQAAKAPSPGPSAAMKDALARVPDDDTVRVAAVANDAMRKRLAAASERLRKLAPKLETVTASVRVTDEVTTQVVVSTTDASAAADARGLLNQSKDVLGLLPTALHLGPFGALLQEFHDNIEITRDGNSVRINITLTEDMLKQADKLGH